MVYLKINMAHPQLIAARQEMTNRFALTHPNNILSVNIKADGTVAWAKLEDDTGLAGMFPGVIINRATPGPEHLDRVQADVYAPGWYPDE